MGGALRPARRTHTSRLHLSRVLFHVGTRLFAFTSIVSRFSFALFPLRQLLLHSVTLFPVPASAHLKLITYFSPILPLFTPSTPLHLCSNLFRFLFACSIHDKFFLRVSIGHFPFGTPLTFSTPFHGCFSLGTACPFHSHPASSVVFLSSGLGSRHRPPFFLCPHPVAALIQAFPFSCVDLLSGDPFCTRPFPALPLCLYALTFRTVLSHRAGLPVPTPLFVTLPSSSPHLFIAAASHLRLLAANISYHPTHWFPPPAPTLDLPLFFPRFALVSLAPPLFLSSLFPPLAALQ